MFANLNEIEQKHLFLRLFYILGILITSVILFFVLFDEPKSALGASLISIGFLIISSIWLLIYLLVESVVFYRKNELKRFYISFIISLFILVTYILVLFFLNL